MAATSRDWPLSARAAAVLGVVLAACALLYWAQLVLIPLALAGLLTFLLTPVVVRLEQWGLGRIPAVLVTVATMALLLGGVIYMMTSQVTSLAAELPRYRQNINQKAEDLKHMFRGGPLEKVQETLDEAQEEFSEEKETERDRESSLEEEPVPVRLIAEEYFFPNTAYLTPLAQAIGTAGLVIVLVLLMLIDQERVLSQLVSLAGPHSLATTTRALDEAGRRISRYLLMQFIINASYGLVLGVGLFFIGVPYSFLWGLSGFIFRYVPYVGPWVAALLPISVSLVHFSGWSYPLVVVALFLVLELVVNNVLEPWLYGQSVGLSAVSVVVAAAFWTWMWGPVGLVLATPLTVCLVVLGEHIPALSIFDRLLSDRPPLKPHLWLYQRLLAGDDEDAEEIVEEFHEEHGLERTCDELLMPTLLFAGRELQNRRISHENRSQVTSLLEETIEELPSVAADSRAVEEGVREASYRARRAIVLGFPLQNEDETPLRMLERLLPPSKCEFHLLSASILIAERLAEIDEKKPVAVCLSSLAPGGLRQARAVCKTIRARHPEIKILLGRWTAGRLSERCGQRFKASGADAIATRLPQMRDLIVPIVQFFLASHSQPDPDSDESPSERAGKDQEVIASK